MYGTTAKDFDPAGAFTETASFSAALEAGNIHLCTGLCEREMMRSEFCLCLRSEQFLCKLFQSSLQVSKRDILVNYKSLNLMEGRGMGCIYFIGTEYTTRCDHTDRKLAFFHSTCLYRGSLRTKEDGIVDEKGILLISRRMILRYI